MKRQYSKPNMSVEMFEANEYIANCVTISCDKPSEIGVFYYNKYKPKTYQEGLDDPITLCRTRVDVKVDSITRDSNLYYDSNGTIPGGTVSNAYYGLDKNGHKHYFLKTPGWDQTKTLAS